MGIWIYNETGEPVIIQDFFIYDASRGSGYYGGIRRDIPNNRRLRLENSIFTEQTIKEMKPLEIHVKINGKICSVLHHDVFKNNKAIIFAMGTDNKLMVYVVHRKTEAAGNFGRRIWHMILPSCGTPEANNIEALIAAAKPWNP